LFDYKPGTKENLLPDYRLGTRDSLSYGQVAIVNYTYPYSYDPLEIYRIEELVWHPNFTNKDRVEHDIGLVITTEKHSDQ